MNYRKLVHELSRIQEIRKSTIISLASAPFLEPDDQHGVLPAIVGDARCYRKIKKAVLTSSAASMLPLRQHRRGFGDGDFETAAADPASGSRSGDRPLCRRDVTP
jgi:hypothetical protein